MINGVKISRPQTKVARSPRARYRTTILTTTRKNFDRVNDLKDGECLTIECPNDIISSARNGQDNTHHSIRRVSLLRRQVAGGYRRVKVRYQQGHEIQCLLTGHVCGEADDNVFSVQVGKKF